MAESDSPEPSELEHIRKRPSMYIPSTGQIGLSFLVGELASNSIDQFLAGNASSIFVRTNQNKITVVDDGTGLPFDRPSKMGNASLLEDYMTTIHRTPTADSHAPHIHLHSSHGVGLGIVNALSESVEVRSYRAGKLWQQTFSRGKVASKSRQIKPEGSSENGLLKGRGTEVTFTPDPDIFEDRTFEPLGFRKRLFDAAHLFAGLKVGLQDEIFCAPDGLAALAATTLMSGTRPLRVQIDSGQFHLELAAFGRAGNTNSRTENAKRKTKWMTWANGWNTVEGGTHKDACQKVFDELKWKPKHALVHIVMKEVEFAGPTRQKLEVAHVEQELVENLLKPIEAYCQKYGQGKFWEHYRPE